MILCVTLNSCLDKTLTVPRWKPGDPQVRGKAVREVVGGKGNNVARALKRLGRDARPVLFLGGPIGQWCEALMRRDDGFEPFIVPTEASTRTILTVRGDSDDAQAEPTAFFDPDPAITAAEAHKMIVTVESLLQNENVEALTMSGSSPSETTHGVYSELIALAKARRIPVFLDTYGPALKAIWGFWPDVMQLNRREAAAHLGVGAGDPTDDQLYEMLDLWASRGVQTGIVTDGPDDLLVRIDGRRLKAAPPEIEAVNPIGSGDCLLAGMTDAWLSGLGPEESLRRGIALAVSNALTWDAGAVDPENLDQIPAAEIEDFQAVRGSEPRGSLRRGWMVPKHRNKRPTPTPAPAPAPSAEGK